MDDKQLQQNIRDELEFEPSVDAAHIGVAVDDGVVTLSGHVSSYAEKQAVERALPVNQPHACGCEGQKFQDAPGLESRLLECCALCIKCQFELVVFGELVNSASSASQIASAASEKCARASSRKPLVRCHDLSSSGEAI